MWFKSYFVVTTQKWINLIVWEKIYDGLTGSEEEDEELFSWEEYLKKCHAKAVPKETFKHVSIFNTICLGTAVEPAISNSQEMENVVRNGGSSK